MGLGSVLLKLGELKRASECYYEAIKFYENVNKPEYTRFVAYAYLMLGIINRDLGDLDLGKSMFKESLQHYNQTTDTLYTISALSHLADLYRKLNKFDSAMHFLSKAMRLSERSPMAFNLTNLYLVSSSIMLDQRKYVEALQYANLAHSVSEEYNLSNSTKGSIIVNMAVINVKLHEYQKAESLFREAINFIERGVTIDKMGLYGALWESYREMGKPKEAFLYFEKFLHLKDSIYNQANAAKISNLRILHEIDQKNAAIKMLENENRIARLSHTLTLAMLVSAVSISVIMIFILWQKIKNNRKTIAQQQKLAENERRLNEVAIKEKEAATAKLKQEVTFKNREMGLIMMNFVQKNDIVEEMKGVLAQLKHSLPEEVKLNLNKLTASLNVFHEIDKERGEIQKYLDQVNQDFFGNLKSNFPDLSPKDIKLCALLRLNLDTKQIATILHMTPESAKVTRHRIKKKLGLESDESLQEFLNEMSTQTL